MTISLAAVFIPLLFMGGIIGRLFHEFAVTIGVAVLVSGFVSLTLSPMLCSRVLKPHAETKHGKLYNASESVFNGMLYVYDVSLQFVLRHSAWTLLLSIGLIVPHGSTLHNCPQGFYSGPGYRPDTRLYGGRPGNLVRLYGRSSESRRQYTRR